MDEIEAPPVVQIVNDVVVGPTTCVKCGQDLVGQKVSGECPNCRSAVSDSLTTTPSLDQAHCIQCGYQLRGIDASGVCPECGTPIERSLRGNLLRYSSIDYVSSLRRGAWLVLASVIVYIVVLFSAFFLGTIASAAGGGSLSPQAMGQIANWLGVISSLMALYGWWLLSALDPAYTGRDQGATARKVVRWAVAIAAAETIVTACIDMLPQSTSGSGAMVLVGGSLAVVSTIVGAVRFFASMFYIRWLAPRLPNAKVYKRAKTLMWLGPVLMTVGILLFLLGPLIAMIMYWNMIYWMWKDLKRIEGEIAFGAAPG